MLVMLLGYLVVVVVSEESSSVTFTFNLTEPFDWLETRAMYPN